MGRPLNKRNFKDADGITVNYWDGTANATAGYIVKQTGSKTFLCAGGGAEKECTLVSKVPAAGGEMAIILLGGLYVTKISGRKLTASNGETFTWSLDGLDGDSSGDHFNLDND